jgi:hypothetical protein
MMFASQHAGCPSTQGGTLMHERRSVYGVGGAAVIAEPLGYRMVWV